MRETYLMTGYPGFLATQLMKQMVADYDDSIDCIYVLVLPQMVQQAREQIKLLPDDVRVKVQIVQGDITREHIGLDEVTRKKLVKSITHVFHLAAIYDLAVEKEIAEQVNVIGTKRVNDWVQTLPHLKRYIYFSTAYVSGRREGVIYEDELMMDQSFRNHYEATKYAAEILVDALKDTIPTTIIRPGIVRGHSVTGETLKFDGIYFILNHFDRLRHLPVIPYLGAGTPKGNFVPYDYVIRATSYLANHDVGIGKTYHLTDPNPYTMHDIYKMLAEYYLGKTPRHTLPLAAVKLGLSNRFVRNFLRVEKEAIDYFTIHSHYDTTNAARDLQDANIHCPDLKDSLQSMIAFYRKYKDDITMHIPIR